MLVDVTNLRLLSQSSPVASVEAGTTAANTGSYANVVRTPSPVSTSPSLGPPPPSVSSGSWWANLRQQFLAAFCEGLAAAADSVHGVEHHIETEGQPSNCIS
jgi:hypothetical protein